MSRRCGSSKPTPTPLTAWPWSQEHAKRSSWRKRRPYNKANQPSEPCRVPPVWRGGGAEKALEPAAYRRCGGGVQERLYGKPTTEKGTMARRAFADMEGNTGANTRQKSYQKPPAGHRHGGGLDEETTNTRDRRWRHLQPREGGTCLAEKRKQNKHNRQTHKQR